MKTLIVALIFLPSMAFAFECELSSEALVKYEKQVLLAKSASQMAEPLGCMLEIQKKAEGMTRYFAANYLRPLLGGGQIAGVLKDKRYQRVSEALEILTLKSKDPLGASVIAQFAHGDWRFYEMFCEQGNTEFCPSFLPDAASLKKESPLLAAASLLRLKKAYAVLKGKERDEVGERIKKLYREIPVAQKLQRKFIDQIYQELFQPLSLSLA